MCVLLDMCTHIHSDIILDNETMCNSQSDNGKKSPLDQVVQ